MLSHVCVCVFKRCHVPWQQVWLHPQRCSAHSVKKADVRLSRVCNSAFIIQCIYVCVLACNWETQKEEEGIFARLRGRHQSIVSNTLLLDWPTWESQAHIQHVVCSSRSAWLTLVKSLQEMSRCVSFCCTQKLDQQDRMQMFPPL